MRLRFYSLVIIVMVASFGLGEVQAKWKKFTSVSGNFAVLFPGKPKLRQRTHKSFVGAIQENNHHYEESSRSFSVEYSDIPGIALTFGGVKRILSGARKNFLKEVQGTQIAYEKASLNGNPGGILKFKAPRLKAQGTMDGQARFYLVKKRLYVLVATGTPELKKRATKKFFNSFELLP